MGISSTRVSRRSLSSTRVSRRRISSTHVKRRRISSTRVSRRSVKSAICTLRQYMHFCGEALGQYSLLPDRRILSSAHDGGILSSTHHGGKFSLPDQVRHHNAFRYTNLAIWTVEGVLMCVVPSSHDIRHYRLLYIHWCYCIVTLRDSNITLIILTSHILTNIISDMTLIVSRIHSLRESAVLNEAHCRWIQLHSRIRNIILPLCYRITFLSFHLLLNCVKLQRASIFSGHLQWFAVNHTYVTANVDKWSMLHQVAPNCIGVVWHPEQLQPV